ERVPEERLAPPVAIAIGGVEERDAAYEAAPGGAFVLSGRVAARLTFAQFLPVLLAQSVDYLLYHAVNAFMRHHHGLELAAMDIETAAVILIAVAAFALWLLARPGGSLRWKLASASALAAAALGLVLNQSI